MKCYKMGKIICLFIFVIVILSGCKTVNKATGEVASTDVIISNTEPSSDTGVVNSDEKVPNISENKISVTSDEDNQIKTDSLETESPTNDYNNEYWKKIKTYSRSIGNTFFEILKKNDVQYTWYDDNSQSIITMDYTFLYFPQLIWNDTTCSAVAVEGDNVFPLDVTIFDTKDIKTYFGDGYTYHEGKDGVGGYYEYELEKCNVIIGETPINGISTTSMYILIKSKNESISLSEIIDTYNMDDTTSEPQDRNPDIWGGINEYLEKIGQDKSEVLINEINWVYDNDSGYYRNPNNNNSYCFDKNDKCIDSIFPMKVLIGESNNQVFTIKEMSEFFKLPFSWYQYEGERYTFYFSDITVYIQSIKNGQVDGDTLVSVTRSSYD